jgi:UDP-glucose 4-epimerase
MKVVVTGASGNVGTALTRATTAQPWELTGVARRRPEPCPVDRWVDCDIGEPGSARALSHVFAGADAVVHLAWAIHPRTDEPDMYRTNVIGTANVLQAVADAGVPHLVCASSVAAYTPAGRWQRVDENWPCGGVPGSSYSAGKAMLESQLDLFGVRHPSVRVSRIRPCGIVQADAAAEFTSWLLGPWVPTGLLDRLPVPLWTVLRLQITHADDVAEAIRLILATGAAGPFNLAAEPVLRPDDLAALFGTRRVAVPLRALVAAAWAGWRLGLQPLHPGWLRLADRASLVDTSRARTELGWTPRHDAAGAVAELAAAIRAGRRGPSAPLSQARRPVRVGRPSHQSQWS